MTTKHPYRFGKREVRKDQRNFQLASLLIKEPKLPVEFNVDVAHPGIKQQMFGNDEYGDCVEAASANFIERAELTETGKVPKITTAQVVKQYFIESGGVDSGLVLLDHLNLWRKHGLKFGSKRYFIQAYAQVSPKNNALIRQSIFLRGVIIGVSLPANALDLFVAGKPWVDTKARGEDGHAMWLVGYNPLGPVALTWARPQQLSWPWLDKYCDESYSLLDSKDTTINHKQLAAMLQVTPT
jgi:hypothetical protein